MNPRFRIKRKNNWSFLYSFKHNYRLPTWHTKKCLRLQSAFRNRIQIKSPKTITEGTLCLLAQQAVFFQTILSLVETILFKMALTNNTWCLLKLVRTHINYRVLTTAIFLKGIIILSVHLLPRMNAMLDFMLDFICREKGRDLTQSYDKSPYTNRNAKRAKWQHKQRHKKVRLNSGCGPT